MSGKYLELRVRAAATCFGLRPIVVLAVAGVFAPVLAKHTKHLGLVDILSVGVDRMQRNVEPMKKQVEAWKGTRLPDETAKLILYRAFVQGEFRGCQTPREAKERREGKTNKT